MDNVIELRSYRGKAETGATLAHDARSADEKASLRLVASLMAFGPAATARQIDFPVTRTVARRRSSTGHR
jgi:hypothetical protein